MEDVTLHIVERPYSGFPDASSEGPEPTQGEARATEEPSGTGSDELIKSDQVNGVLVLSLLDKIIGAVDQIQLTQAQLEERQAEMEGAVQSIQGELSKLGKAHATTSNTVSKLLEKVRKVSVNVKTVRGSLERQAGQIKKLEVNEAELLRRRNFKVMIYQVSPRGGPRPELGSRPGIRVGTPGRGSSLRQPGLVRAVRSSSPLPVNPVGVGFREWQTLGAHRGAHPAPSSPGSSPRSLTPIGKVSGLDLGTLNAPSLSLSNAFPLGGSFFFGGAERGKREGMPEVSGGLCMPLCKQTLKVGPGTWGLRRCGPDIAGDSGLRHAVAGAPCKGHDRQPPTPYPRAPAPTSATHACP
jgi:hypothetical protein